MKRAELLLRSVSIEPASKGGSFVTFRAGGLGMMSDPAAIEAQLRQLGAVWVQVPIRESGWGDRLTVKAIFRETPEVLRAEQAAAEAEAAAAAKGIYEVILRPSQDDPREGLVTFRRAASIVEGEQRWKRCEGAEALSLSRIKGSSWLDLRAPGPNFIRHQTVAKPRAEWAQLLREHWSPERRKEIVCLCPESGHTDDCPRAGA